MTADKPSSAEGWALVDFMANVITDAQDAPHFTTAEHALMAAGELERGWLAAHDRAVKAEALRESAAQMRECKDPGHWNLRGPRNPETAYSPDVWLEHRADLIEKGADA